MITYTNSLDFCPGGVPLFIRLSQYDSNFSLVFNCFSHKGNFTVESGSTAVFREHKPDGNVISIDATVSETTVTLTPSAANAKQMTAIKGHCECEISLQKNGKELSSANFVLLVEKAPVDIDAVQSDSVVRELYDVADRAEEILEAAETVDEAISDLPNLIDSTLTLPNHAADAKKTGDEISSLKSAIDEIEPGLSDDAKTALLNCFANVAWANEYGQTYYNALESALYSDTAKLRAVFIQGGAVVYPDTSLNDLRQYLTVTVVYPDQTTEVVSDYILSGTLSVGTSMIRVLYQELTTTFAVEVSSRRRTELPSIYEQVEYIKSTGTQWIVLDNLLSQVPMRLEATASFQQNGKLLVSTGIRNNADTRFYVAGMVNNRIASRYGNNNYIEAGAGNPPVVDTIYDITSIVQYSSDESSIYAKVSFNNGEQEATQPVTSGILGNPLNIMRNGYDNTVSYITLYSLVLYSGTNKLFDGIPCYRKSDSVSGLYDPVSSAFYPSNGTNNFEVGTIVP